MTIRLPFNCLKFFYFLLLLSNVNVGMAQSIQVNIIGNPTSISNTATIAINAGTALNFRVTNKETANCDDLEIQSISITNTPIFSVIPATPSGAVKPASCAQWWWYFFCIKSNLDFKVQNNSPSSGCVSASSTVTIKIKNKPDFTFTLQVNTSPKINVLGGSPLADILHNSSIPSATNATYFGVVEAGAQRTRNYTIVNTGTCPLNISGVSVVGTDFTVPASFTASIAPGASTILPVTFKGPPASYGKKTATINILNNDNSSFKFNVNAEVFFEDIPGPGGVTSGFKLWLKATRGITKDASSKVLEWADLGTNPKNAKANLGNEPTYLDDALSNINFNPVIDFKNGSGTEQFMYNDELASGFYSSDIFIVMVPDSPITSTSPKNTILAGIESATPGDVTGVGYGNYSTAFSNEVLSYNQGIPGSGTFTGSAEIDTGKSYAGVGIINVTDNLDTAPTAHDILYNSKILTTAKAANPFGSLNGSWYWIGKNYNETANLNGRVAEIFTFSTKLDATSRQKVESYLAIKYGITLGTSTIAEKDYLNSFGTKVWKIADGFNHDVAGIARDSISDLKQRQSKTANTIHDVTIGLGGIFPKNSDNPNDFNKDGDFLMWGNNGGTFTTSGATETVNLGTGINTSVERIDRIWKIVESTEVLSDVGNVYLSIPASAFGGFPKASNQEYALIVADDPAFATSNIMDVIPLRPDASGNLFNWYNFDGTKYFTFGKVSRLTGNHALTLEDGEYLLGDYALNLNVNDFTISAWVKGGTVKTNPRTIMSKGEKLQMRLNTSDEVEIVIDGAIKFTSTMALSDSKWHQITFVYDSGSVFLYIDGVLDKTEQNVMAPSPNFNNFCIGALYVNNNDVSNFFLGQIDEAYIWDQGLTREQVRYLMNQEIERSPANFVSGKVIPFAASSNVVATIPWSKLKVYYNFNAFYGSTIEGQANADGSTTDRYFIRINYLSEDKAVLSPQTAPLPYVSANDGAWDDPATWEHGSEQVLPNALGLNGVRRVDWNIAQISHEITSEDNDIALLGLILENTGKLTIANPFETPDETNSGHGLAISHYLELDGVIDLVGESQLLQSEGSILDADSGGYIERDQQGTANGFNYNYWSSSVGPTGNGNATLGTGLTYTNESNKIEGFLNNGTSTAAYTPLLFDGVAYHFTPSGPPGLIKTIFTYWLYKFYGAANAYDAWEKIDEKSYLMAGEGFTMKGPSGPAPLSSQQNYVFKGLPYNGNFTLPLLKSITGTNPLGDVDRLIGNPYPSAMDATQFILDNISVADGGNNPNGTVFNGALYFWDHFGKEDTHILKGYVGGYATRNLTGGAAAISNDTRINSTSNGGSAALGGKEPGQYIPVNQGFFVSTAVDATTGSSLTSVDGGDIVFKNSQRAYQRETGPSSVFFKQSNKKNDANSAPSGKPTIRLIYDSPLGYHRQLVIGANMNATDGFDMGYDAFMIDVNEEDMYWSLNDAKLVIQGVSSFDASKEFSLGLIVQKEGVATIKVEALENMDASTNLYIKDAFTNQTHLITNNAFDVFLPSGIYNNRFKLVFQNTDALSTETVEANTSNLLVYFDGNTSEIKLINKNGVYVSNVNLYTVLGQDIKNMNVRSSKSESIRVKLATGVYIIKLKTEKGVLSKKILVE